MIKIATPKALSRLFGILLSLVILNTSAQSQSIQSEVSSLNAKGFKSSQSGDYAKAAVFFEKALAIEEKLRDPQQLDIAVLLDNLTDAYISMGNYAKAFSLAERALTIREKLLGPDNLGIEASLFNLGRIHFAMGNYTKALLLSERALSITEKSSDPKGPAYSSSALSNLSKIYCTMGNYAKALPLAEKALAISEKISGPDSLKTKPKLLSLARIYQEMGNYGKALPLAEKALAISEKSLGPEHPETAGDLCCIANIYLDMKERDKAMSFYERALAISEKTLGPDHPDTGDCLENIGTTYFWMNNYAKAVPFYERVLAIKQKTLGPQNQFAVSCLYDLALAQYLSGGDLPTIREELTRIWDEKLRQMESVLDMDEPTRLAWQRIHLEYKLIHLLRSEQVALIILRTKGAVLDSMIEDRAALKGLGADTPEFLELQSARFRIGQIAFSTKKQDQDEVQTLKARIDSIISSVSNKRTQMGGSRIGVTVTPDAIASALPPEGLLIDFIQFVDFKNDGNAVICYGVLILGRDGEPKFVRIDDAVGIDAAIQATRDAIKRGDEKALVKNQKIVFEKLWEPLSKNLPSGIKKIYIGADGQLNFLSFTTLSLPDGSFLGEHYDIAYVGSGRDLTRKVSEGGAKAPKTIELFADPIFERNATTYSTNELSLRSGELEQFGRIVLPPLPGTRSEEAVVEATARATGWSPKAHLGEQANKSDLIALKRPGILHLATHGFYLNTLSEGESGERGMKVIEAANSHKNAAPPKIDPMNASGIALAGAQTTLKAWSEGRVPDPKNDGILNAEEVAGLDLDDTWLVTLSACETGVGQSRAGEGVFGLRRAFMMAGAQNLLMTLWPVSDEVTPKIMADFYKEALATRDAAGSLAKVQRDWLVKLRKEKGLLAAVRDAGPFAMVVMAKPNAKKEETSKQATADVKGIQVAVGAQKNTSKERPEPQQSGGTLSTSSSQSNENKNSQSLDEEINNKGQLIHSLCEKKREMEREYMSQYGGKDAQWLTENLPGITAKLSELTKSTDDQITSLHNRLVELNKQKNQN